MIEFWHLTVVGHAILVIGYAWIASILFIGNTSAGQWRANPLATATFLIFLSCGIGHGFHVFHAFEARIGIESTSTAAARVAMGDPLLAIWALATALVAAWYLTMRNRLELVSKGAPLCEDMQRREVRAAHMQVPIQDAIGRAQLLLEKGEAESARDHIDEALRVSRVMITELIGDSETVRIRAGDLRRRGAA